ncbi:hypothetical protein Patl1_18045 [Pistacia atlantica]|uniref:Uncharacterized protein n=1 Tax=Pistacia atlantica TaxID=434234 RepID=A0ACC1C3S2_9ROSI|nr:hypothetical protein Patl1_18045 [Pistacia atlantica]
MFKSSQALDDHQRAHKCERQHKNFFEFIPPSSITPDGPSPHSPFLLLHPLLLMVHLPHPLLILLSICDVLIL